jgi:hypothetical protein
MKITKQAVASLLLMLIMPLVFSTYYESNGFVPLHKSEDDEKEYHDIAKDEHLKTRLMYFDLKQA